MKSLGAALVSGQGLVIAVTVIGCATAGLITGHLTASDWGTAVGLTLGSGALVGTAHVVGTQVNAAASSAAVTPAPVQAPGGVV